MQPVLLLLKYAIVDVMRKLVNRAGEDRQTSIVSSKQGKLLKLPSYKPSIQFIQLNNNIGGGTVAPSICILKSDFEGAT